MVSVWCAETLNVDAPARQAHLELLGLAPLGLVTADPVSWDEVDPSPVDGLLLYAPLCRAELGRGIRRNRVEFNVPLKAGRHFAPTAERQGR